jgi:predicted NBD/HSP70 family sugar kinase
LDAPLAAEEAHSAIADLALRALRASGVLDDSMAQDSQPLVSLCVVIDGQVEPAMGTLVQADGLPEWSNLPLGHQLSQRLALVTIDTAVNAAAIAEAALGAGKSVDSMLYVSLGRRVRAAFLLHGAIARGDHGRAGQLGHWCVSSDGPRCACGTRGHLDPVASAQSIVRNMIGLASGNDESHEAMLRVAHGRAESMGAAQVIQLAVEGDSVAQAVVSAAVDGLSAALGNLVAALDPGVIVVDGPFGGQMETLLERVRGQVHDRTATFARPIPICASHLGPRASLEGARLIALQAVESAGQDG